MSKSHHIAKKGGNRTQQSPKRGFLFSGKMFLRFRDCLRRPFAHADVPFGGFLVFGKKVFPISGLSHESLQKCACPFLDDSYFRKIMVAGWQRFCNLFSGDSLIVFRPRIRPTLFVVIRIVVKRFP